MGASAELQVDPMSIDNYMNADGTADDANIQEILAFLFASMN